MKLILIDWNVNIPINYLEEACTQTGVSPRDKDVSIGQLISPWNGHPSGSIIKTGSFPDIDAKVAIVEIKK